MVVYRLVSINTPDKIYTGITKDLRQRLATHNCGGVKCTSNFRPWRIENALWFADIQKARCFERYLKSGSGRAFAKRHF
jgi:predicted GIY-YIG superfamily endonuclease